MINNIIKKTLSVILATVLLVVIALPDMVFATENTNDCTSSCDHDHDTDYIEGQEITWEQEVIVEVSSEEEFLLYPKNPNYKYTFVITRPSLTRAVCYNCGKSAMSTVTYKEQASGSARMCPIIKNGFSDLLCSWNNNSYERCMM